MPRSSRSDLAAVGVDGDRHGWVAAAGRTGGGTELQAFATVAELWAWRAAEPGGAHAPVLIDVPIGLAAETGHRACDRAAAARLGPRRACVFQPPGRYLLAACEAGPGAREVYRRARDLVAERRAGAADPARVKSLSAQAAGLLPKVRSVDAFLADDPARGAHLAECHPEVSFAALNGGTPLPAKTSEEGRATRRALVHGGFPDSEAHLAAWAARRGRSIIDALDAYAALWSALRWAGGAQTTLGDGSRDAVTGAPMRVVV